MEFLFGIIIGLTFSGGIGYLIGSVKGNGSDGMWWGLLLGPLGWVIVLCQSDKRKNGAALPSPERIGKPDPFDQFQAQERAKTILEAPPHLRRRKVEDDES